MRAEELLEKKYQIRHLISNTDSSSQDSEKSEKETVPTNVVSDKSGVVVQVNLSPQFNISDTNDVMLFGSLKLTSRSWLTILEAKLQQCSVKLMRIHLLQHKEGTWERY